MDFVNTSLISKDELHISEYFTYTSLISEDQYGMSEV